MDPVLASAIFVLGLAFGSFLNVCIYRLPRDLSVVRHVRPVLAAATDQQLRQYSGFELADPCAGAAATAKSKFRRAICW